MAAKTERPKAPVAQAVVDACIAHAITDGDIVNFRFLFVAHSPLRVTSPEDIGTPKYAYLNPSDTGSVAYREALALVQRPEAQAYVRGQLEKQGPPQLPSEMLLLLADNAVRLGKYSAAAQAYELLRIRRRMQEEFFALADAALDGGDVAQAVQGYVVATGLAYDYAAFPEPAPLVPNYHARALMLHAEYPRRPEDCIALQPEEQYLKTALTYLLLSPEASARLASRPQHQLLDFVELLIRRRDPDWETFAEQYRAAIQAMRELGERLERAAAGAAGEASLAEEVADQQASLRPENIPGLLLGRQLEDGEWWQYMKELAYRHPPAALFVSRQAVSKDLEILVPRYRSDSALVQRLGLNA